MATNKLDFGGGGGGEINIYFSVNLEKKKIA
jgi:hypothetical protein